MPLFSLSFPPFLILHIKLQIMNQAKAESSFEDKEGKEDVIERQDPLIKVNGKEPSSITFIQSRVHYLR